MPTKLVGDVAEKPQRLAALDYRQEPLTSFFCAKSGKECVLNIYLTAEVEVID